MATSPLPSGRTHPEKTRFPERWGLPRFNANLFESREFHDIAGGPRRGDNPHYQLNRAEYPAPSPFNGEIHSWSYDAIGNRLTNTVNTATQNYTYLKNGQNPLNGQKLANDGTNAYTYDFNGNTLTRTGYGFGYDAENRLTSITGNETAAYTYDYQGRRTSKTVSGVTTTYLYDGLNLIAETAAGQTSYFLNGAGTDEPLAMSKAGAISYFSVDGLGSVVATSDPTGAVSHSVVFDAWGNTKSEVGTRIHPFTYTGREVAEAGQLFYRARFYQSSIGRFTQEDPAAETDRPHTRYHYVRNAPIASLDPLGLFPLPDCIKNLLRPYYQGVDFDKVDIRFGIPWYVKLTAKITPAAVTINDTIYFATPSDYDPNSVSGVAAIAHELLHSQQFRQAGGKVAFLKHYVREYRANKRLGLSDDDAYRQIDYERDAYDHQEEVRLFLLFMHHKAENPCCLDPR